MTEQYYDPIVHGLGIEGFINYANLLVEGWLVSLFLLFIWIASVFVGSKSEWKMSGIITFSFFITMIASMIFKLFTTVNPLAIYLPIFGLAIGLFWMVIEK